MDEVEIITGLVGSVGQWAVFLWLYLRERRYSHDCAQARQADAQRWPDTLNAIILQQRNPTSDH